MLSQRIAKGYLYLAWRGDSAAARGELKSASDEFARALAELRAAPENSAAIGEELAAVASLWQELEPLLRVERPRAADRAKAVQLADAILVRMERATSLYEKLTGA